MLHRARALGGFPRLTSWIRIPSPALTIKPAEDVTYVPKIKNTLRLLIDLYGETLACDFGPLALKGVRHGLLCIEGLRRGRCGARESQPVKQVDDVVVAATLPFLCPTVRAMVQVQQLTGMRSGELVVMRGVDIDTSSDVWRYTPQHHKTVHHGHSRVIAIGPKAQEILKPFLPEDPSQFVFSPRRARDERNAAKRAARKTNVQPSQINRRKRSRRARRASATKPRRTAALCDTVSRRLLRLACRSPTGIRINCVTRRPRGSANRMASMRLGQCWVRSRWR
jgi:hypothetical protein